VSCMHGLKESVGIMLANADKLEWSVQKVIQMAGIRLEDADDGTVALAREAMDRCYYLDRSAEWMLYKLQARHWLR
jgi:hypothetical protein